MSLKYIVSSVYQQLMGYYSNYLKMQFRFQQAKSFDTVP